ncbi:MAG: hypothetical protein Barrevirus2_8 [Barrevirus sp.]|uniref:Uncharacterized protein n=1 Tax=Barrevirus sp. TaxID=2487763 RepID=A0A3G4ZPN7_9VIRU|nr:MAG: hypothetical protein Barrevirus2_8 [Barrevirus sp.]
MSIPNLTKKEIIDELLKKQLKSVPVNKLSYDDIQRLGKYIKSSIFDENKCSLWNGYIANSDNENKGIYINFYYKGKKIALHRILYVNYVGPLTDTEYLKFSCENKGKCCNIKHIQKFKYIVKKNKTIGTTKEGIVEDQNKDTKKKNSKSFVITFD